MYKYIVFVILAFLFSCGEGKQEKSIEQKEDFEAKSMLQGVWLDENTDSPMLQIKGDSIYYIDASTTPVAFKIVADSLYTFGVHTTSYHIEKQAAYTFWIRTEIGDLIQLSKADSSMDSIMLAVPSKEVASPSRQVIQKDRVVIYNNTRYRGYVYINPSNMKVVRPEYSEEGFKIDNVYYDNIIHICVYEGKNELFGKDILKKDFAGIVPDDFLQWAVLTDMDFMGVNEKGYQYQATVCIPNEASCYIVNISISKDKEITYLLEE